MAEKGIPKDAFLAEMCFIPSSLQAIAHFKSLGIYLINIDLVLIMCQHSSKDLMVNKISKLTL